MNYCIIRSGNKQYQVKVGSIVKLELLDAPVGPIVFDDVLLSVDGDKVEIGMPTLEDFKVYGTVLGQVKADKVQVFKYKSKSRYRKLRGHRQQYTEVKIEGLGSKPTVAAKPKKTSTKKAVK
jgi:large subunit ribosomal protein L21